MKHTYRKGQRVRVVSDIRDLGFVGEFGRVVDLEVCDFYTLYRVELGNGKGRPWFYGNELEPIKRGRPSKSETPTSKELKHAIKETRDHIERSKPYKPSLGETVRVVECESNDPVHEDRVGKVTDIDRKSGRIRVDWNNNFCMATKVEPVEKKQLPSELEKELRIECVRFANRILDATGLIKIGQITPNHKEVTNIVDKFSGYFYSIFKQHIAGREK